MLYVKVAVERSPIADKGLFAKQFIRRGQIIGLLPQDSTVLTETEYQAAQARGDELILRSAVRWVGDYFICGKEIGPEEYINHSDDPNMLYHCGILIARRVIQEGEEMTAHYRYFLAHNDVGRFRDTKTETLVDGTSAKDALFESCLELTVLLCELDSFGD